MPGKRNPDKRKVRLIEAVGETLTEKGYEALTLNKIMAQSGVSKPMIYEYYGGLNGLLKAYISGRDFWMPYLESIQLPDKPTTEELKNCFIKMLQDQFRYFHQEKEMQRLVHWQIRSYNPLMRATCEAREREGQRLLKLTDEHFRKSGINFRAVIATLVGGVYYNVLHDAAGLGTMAGIELKNEKDFEIMLKTLAQMVDWAFRSAEQA